MDTSSQLDRYWHKFCTNFKNYVRMLPCNSLIENLTAHGSSGLHGCPNLLFHAVDFPIDLVWEHLLQSLYGSYTHTPKQWDKDLMFTETPYYFHIDMSIPNQSKNLTKITNFIKEIVNHKCIHNDRHIFVLTHIDHLLQSEKGSSQAFRVLLERFSSNAIFICTTKSISNMEKPLISRFVPVRIPQFTTEQIKHILQDIGIQASNDMSNILDRENRNIAYCIYAAIVHSSTKTNTNTNTVNVLRYPFLTDYIGSKTKPTLEQLRSLTAKIHAYNISLRDLTLDIMNMNNDISAKLYILQTGSQVDHLISKTDGNRKALYIEYFLNTLNTHGLLTITNE